MFSIKHSTRTEGRTKINTIIWTIQNFIKLLDQKETREFRTGKLMGKGVGKYQLKMQFLGRDNDIIEIYYLSPNPMFHKSVLTIFLKRFEERTIRVKEYQLIQANKWQFLATFFKRDIASSIGREIFILSDGSLSLKFEFIFDNDIKFDFTHVPDLELNNDYKNLFNNGSFSDITIKSAEGTEFKVHKAVLASRSAVFKAYFENNTTECSSNVVESHLKSEVLHDVLTYIYSDKAPRVDEIPEKLLAAADYYKLSWLKNLCEEALQRKLTVENAFETLQLADLHSCNALQQLTLEFIKDGQAKLITKTEGWAKLKSVELVKRIYEYIMSDDLDSDIVSDVKRKRSNPE